MSQPRPRSSRRASNGGGRYRKVPVRYLGIEYVADGVVFHGEVDQREFATVTARVVMTIDTDLDLHLDLQADLAQFAYTDDTFEVLLMPLISPEWTVTPINPANFPILRAALKTGEIDLRVVTPTGERIFRATHAMSDRWLGDNWAYPLPTERDRLLLPIGRDGALRPHAKAAKVFPVRNNDAEGEHALRLKNLIIPPRTACIFCDDPKPTTVEHVIPNWSRRGDDGGVTVASCDPCNGALSPLESSLADLSRAGAAFDNLSGEKQQLVYFWGIKTIWALGKALGIDPLRGAGRNVIARLTARHDLFEIAPTNEIDAAHASIESSDLDVDFLKFGSASEQGRPWAMIGIRNVVVSVWLDH